MASSCKQHFLSSHGNSKYPQIFLMVLLGGGNIGSLVENCGSCFISQSEDGGGGGKRTKGRGMYTKKVPFKCNYSRSFQPWPPAPHFAPQSSSSQRLFSPDDDEETCAIPHEDEDGCLNPTTVNDYVRKRSVTKPGLFSLRERSFMTRQRVEYFLTLRCR